MKPKWKFAAARWVRTVDELKMAHRSDSLATQAPLTLCGLGAATVGRLLDQLVLHIKPTAMLPAWEQVATLSFAMEPIRHQPWPRSHLSPSCHLCYGRRRKSGPRFRAKSPLRSSVPYASCEPMWPSSRKCLGLGQWQPLLPRICRRLQSLLHRIPPL